MSSECMTPWWGEKDAATHLCDLPVGHREMKHHGAEHRCVCGAGSLEKDILEAATWRRMRWPHREDEA